MKRKSHLIFLMVICLSIIIFQSSSNAKDDTTKQLTTKLMEALQNWDLDALMTLYDDNAVMMISGESEPVKGKEAIRANQEGWYTAFPDLKYEFGIVLSSNNEFCIEWFSTGTHTGPLHFPDEEIAPTGRTVKFRGAFLGKASPKGLVIEDRTYFDIMDLMNQLGLTK